MEKALSLILSIALILPMLSSTIVAGDLTFKKTKVVAIEGDKTKEIKAIITWGQDKVTVKLQKFKDRRKYADLEGTFLYKQMSDLTYERSKHSRIATAILLSPLVLFSRRKHHWFSWNYVNDDGKKSSVLLRIDKKEEKIYRRQVPNLTELELEEIIE